MERTAHRGLRSHRLGELRFVRNDVSSIARLLYRVMGVADPRATSTGLLSIQRAHRALFLFLVGRDASTRCSA